MASKTKRVQLKIRLDNVRLSFASIFEPSALNEGDAKTFSGHFLLGKDHPQYSEMTNALRKIAKAKWGANGGAVLKELVKAERLCFRSGNKKRDDDGKVMDGYEDMFYVSARSKVRPSVFGLDPKKGQLTDADGKIYSGCFVNVFVSLWAQTGQYGKRINAQLQGLQFVSEGEQFGGGGTADASVFDTIANEFDDDDEVFDADDLVGDDDVEDDDDFAF